MKADYQEQKKAEKEAFQEMKKKEYEELQHLAQETGQTGNISDPNDGFIGEEELAGYICEGEEGEDIVEGEKVQNGKKQKKKMEISPQL